MLYAGDVTPSQAHDALAADPAAVLVDVRMPAELSFVGMPTLDDIGKSLLVIPWNPQLTPDQLTAQLAGAGVGPDDPIYFICRSGARSANAAALATSAGYGECYNVSGGFEGPPDAAGHRGTVAGWKVEGLPWRQQ